MSPFYRVLTSCSIVSNVSLNARISALKFRFNRQSVCSVADSINLTWFLTSPFFCERGTSDFFARLSTASKTFHFFATMITIIWSTFVRLHLGFYFAWLHLNFHSRLVHLFNFFMLFLCFNSQICNCRVDLCFALICSFFQEHFTMTFISVTTQVLQMATLYSPCKRTLTLLFHVVSSCKMNRLASIQKSRWQNRIYKLNTTISNMDLSVVVIILRWLGSYACHYIPLHQWDLLLNLET